MTSTGEPSQSRLRKRKRIDYTAVVNRHVASAASLSPQERDTLSHLRRHESLDAYARLQSLIGGM